VCVFFFGFSTSSFFLSFRELFVTYVVDARLRLSLGRRVGLNFAHGKGGVKKIAHAARTW